MRKLALVLPGGGACGRWQAGVISYLYDIGVIDKVDLFVGTSVGGLNTLAIAKYKDNIAKFNAMWANIKKDKDIFDGTLKLNVFSFIGQVIKDNKFKCIVNPKGLYKILDTEFNMKAGDLAPFIITGTDIISGERVLFNNQTDPDRKASLIGKATSAIPAAFPAVEDAKKLYVDGGLGRNNPIAIAADEGATHIILIGTTSDNHIQPKQVKNQLTDLIMRDVEIAMNIFEEEAWEEMKAHPDIKKLDIYPEESTGSALDFSNVEQFKKGYDFAFANLSPKVIEDFLK